MEHLEELWSRFGYWRESLISRNFEGQEGQSVMDSLMASLRKNPPQSIASLAVTAVRDYKDGTTKSKPEGIASKNIHLPSSNVLQFVLEDGSLVTARPSGTEPKIKFYASCRSDNGADYQKADKELAERIKGIDAWVSDRITAAGG